jgi:UDP-glucose 4-epimerase
MGNCLVTGGAGFIGSNLCLRLLEEGHRVRVLDNLATGKRENVSEFVANVEFIQGDVRDPDTVRLAMKNIETVFHLAAIPSVPRSVEDPRTSTDVNIMGTLTVLEEAVNAGVAKVVYASSSSIYGESEVLPKVETMSPKPISPYAANKIAGEHLLSAFYHCYHLQTISLRYFNVFGPKQDPHSQYAAVIPAFITAMLHGKQPVIYGDGKQTRDFTFVENVVLANIAASKTKTTNGASVNIAAGARYSLLDLVNTINEILGTKITPIHEPARPGDVKHSQADISAAAKLIKYQPAVDFKTGLQRTVEYYKKAPVA